MNESARSTAKRRPDLDTVYTINEDGSRNFIHTADVSGRWQRRKTIVYTLLILIYLSLPWIRIHGGPAIHLDLPGRTAHLFGIAFTNQDFYLVFFLVTGLGFSLFVITSLLGRIWCGYACPQTVFLEGVFRRIERLLEGSRERRLRRNSGPWTLDRAWRKLVKHGLYLLLAAVIAHAFLAYFIPPERLFGYLRSGPSGHWVPFGWTLFWTAVLYFDYSWFREQTCLIICPYGRLQSALIDADTVIIGYDEKRGEPRSKKTGEGGDCVDCFRCVSVCPTGIDIRRGLQMECIGCANCIDACDAVMEKLDRPKGLVRYDSHRGFTEGVRRSLVRPRVFLYGTLALVGLTVFASVALRRTSFDVRVLRPQGLPYSLVDGKVRNLYTVRIQNKTDAAETYFVEPEAGAV
ncbi:MAG: cytochrome c oxidase accessory protein CcoG, partial [Candidatus Eisenbacteria bacterium]|nr:cytochrome c oxidase accessory protein CcoG [Candidatus Eisenbacteria bacterium]